MALSPFERLVMSSTYVQARYEPRNGEFRIHWHLDRDGENVMTLSQGWSDLLSRSSYENILDYVCTEMLKDIYQVHVINANEKIRKEADADPPGDHP
jgi:hypothetical protein